MKNKNIIIAALVLSLAALLAGCPGGGGAQATLNSIEVTPANPSISLGATRQFKATGTYSDKSMRDLTASVAWSSTDETTASISATGLVALKAVGPTTIRAASGNISGETTLIVRDNTNAVNLPQTGQKAINAAGDDGSLQRGVDWPSPRFTNPDGTTPVTGSVVVDNLTGLVWLKDANCINTNYASFDNDGTQGDGLVTWQHALDFVAGMNAGTYPGCGGGLTGWRLPNRKELRSLIDYSQYNPALPIGHPFTNVQAAYYYWSSTSATYNGVSDFPWFVTMYDGGVTFGSKTSDLYVWPVRLGQ